MQILMTATVRGSSDGHTVKRYLEGQTYEIGNGIGHSLACTFLHKKQAEQVNAPTVEEEVAKLMDLLKAGRSA